MIYRFVGMLGLIVLVGIGSASGALAHDFPKWTPAKIWGLKGTVLKKHVKYPVKLSTGQTFKMAGFFYFNQGKPGVHILRYGDYSSIPVVIKMF